MLEIKTWMDEFLQALETTFSQRVWFVGLQGSYGRGEQTENSDLDVVVILDELATGDIAAYSAMLDTLPHRELICGFLSGKKELFAWETSDLFQFYHDTTPIRGSLEALRPQIDDAAIDRAIKTGVCNIYHGCVHNMVHEKSSEVLKALYKAASFTVQAICFRQTGRYVSKQQDLLCVLDREEKAIAETFCALKQGAPVDFAEMSQRLFTWAQKWITKGTHF